jgi:hypothetical protein
MNKINSRKSGFPVLAHLLSDLTSLCPCKLTFKCNNGERATILLEATVPLDDLDDGHTFVAQYDADNLITSALQVATIQLSQDQSEKITRHACPQMVTLSLSLKKPCPLWYSAAGPMASKAGFETLSHPFVGLVKATAVHITLDYNWVHKNMKGPFEQLAKGQVKLTAYPVRDYYVGQNFQLTDWVFGPADADDSPPPYADACHKRGGSPLFPLSPKRILYSTPEHLPPSPTELASSPVTEKAGPKALSDDDERYFQSAAIGSAVERYLPSALEKVLPALLPTLFATSHPIAPSSGSATSQPALTPLGQSLLLCLVAHVQPHLQDLYSDALYGFEQQQANAAEEFREDLEDHKVVMEQIKNDNVDELQGAATGALEEARIAGSNLVEDLGFEAYVAVRDRIDMLRMARIRALEECKCEVAGGGADWRRIKGARGSWKRRGKGGYRGLGGRWRVNF